MIWKDTLRILFLIFMSSSDCARRRSRDVEELVRSACQIWEQPLMCSGLTPAFLSLLKKKEPQIKLLMSCSGWLRTGERFKNLFSPPRRRRFRGNNIWGGEKKNIKGRMCARGQRLMLPQLHMNPYYELDLQAYGGCKV